MNPTTTAALAALMTLSIATPARAARSGNVDLSTLPSRASVQLTIYNSEDLTLVRETRKLSFKPGMNRLQFSWQGTRIDPTSVQLRFLEHGSELELIDTTFPHAKPHMLYWNVHSERAGDAAVEVSYFTSGISWSADYVAITDPEAGTLSMESFVRVSNQSGEDYEGAQVRLVVGSLNLVQRIAELAGVAPTKVKLLGEKKREFRNKATRRAIQASEDMMADMASAGGASVTRPKDVTKDSLSEYYLFTVEGTETVPTGWSKRLRSFAAREVPYRILHRHRPAQYGAHLERVLQAKNDRASKLGKGPLPDGVVRVFATVDGGLSYLGEQRVRYVPMGEELEVRLGKDPDVQFELLEEKVWRDEFVFKNQHVVGWDEHVVYRRRIRNFSKRPLNLELRERLTGDAVFTSELDVKRHDASTVELVAQVDAGDTLELPYLSSQRLGRRARHNQTEIARGPASRSED